MASDVTIFKQLSDGGARRHRWTELTPDLLEKARARLRTLAWLMLAITTVGALFDILYAAFVMGRVDPVWLVAGGAGAVLSVALVITAKDRRVSHVTVLHFGLVYEVLVCFLLAVITPWFMYAEVGDVPYVTWVTPLIILFPLIVPSPPLVTLLTAIAAAATRPLGLAVLEVFVGIDVSPIRYLGSSFSPAFAVPLAYVGSRIVHGMNVDLAKARRMGSYKLQSRLGAGGMGEVWRAEHHLLARPAAVKLIRPETVARDAETQRIMLARFEREAQVTAALRSPHTVQLYDFGIEQGGTFYYVMEFLDGLDLETLVVQFGPSSPARTVKLLLQVCDSLAEAHLHGLIHRDVKPANVYVCRYGRWVDFAKVLDFGLVKFRDGAEEPDVKLTRENTVGGTPGFIAPEQVLGLEIDGRADIYSLGCVAYWMLTGTHVFEGRTTLETMMLHVQAEPEAPSKRAAQHVPDSLERIVMACLAKDPDARPRSVTQLEEMLVACEPGERWTQEMARQWWDRHLSSGSPSGPAAGRILS